jgi:hypothetical protein
VTLPVFEATEVPVLLNAMTDTVPTFTVAVLLIPTVMETVCPAMLNVAVPLPGTTVTGGSVGERVGDADPDTVSDFVSSAVKAVCAESLPAFCVTVVPPPDGVTRSSSASNIGRTGLRVCAD